MDVNVRAFRLVQEALKDRPDAADIKKEAAKEASKRGGRIGGPSRARAISKERRIEIATKASRVRWSKKRAEG